MPSSKWLKRRYCTRVLRHILGNRGVYVVDEDWDNLIILDACRYDLFGRINIVKGKLGWRTSRGSSTEEFLIENFKKHPAHSSFNDIVYVTANPFVSMHLIGKFYRIYPVWDYGWDSELNTVPPKEVYKESLKARQEHPNKRLISHFMQPHLPFLLAQFPSGTGISRLRRAILEGPETFQDSSLEDLVKSGIDLKKIWQAYKENLRIVLESANHLIHKLYGKTVVTSDHGNLFGEIPHLLYPFRTYGHQNGLHVKNLVKVPWLVIDRRDVAPLNEERARIRSRIEQLKAKRKV